MAGLSGHRNISDGLFGMLMAAESGIKNDVQEAALLAAIAGEDEVRHTIDTTESSLREGKDNRNWTRNMRRSVDSKVQRNGNTITIRVGWIDNKENYFLLQNDGADLVRNGVVTTITPMNALMNGHTEIIKSLTRSGLKTT